MIPHQSIDARITQARDDVARKVAALAERTKDCREAKRQMFEARETLERLLVEANSGRTAPGVH